jgi:hypothetical protein
MSNSDALNLPQWLNFLIDFDLTFQIRRLHFVVWEVNTHYNRYPLAAQSLDQFKTKIYQLIDNINHSMSQQTLEADLVAEVKACFAISPSATSVKKLLKKLKSRLDIEHFRKEADEVMAGHDLFKEMQDVGRDVMLSYLGFAFWDVATFTVTGVKGLGENNPVDVNRISPNDPSILKKTQDEMPLKGTDLKSFGAFFSREDRENDYLWGRLNGAERLIDFLTYYAKTAGLEQKVDGRMMKKRAFRAILKTEMAHLKESEALFEDIKERIDHL